MLAFEYIPCISWTRTPMNDWVSVCPVLAIQVMPDPSSQYRTMAMASSGIVRSLWKLSQALPIEIGAWLGWIGDG